MFVNTKFWYNLVFADTNFLQNRIIFEKTLRYLNRLTLIIRCNLN